jgi:RNA polymerase sigma factor (sigma-70 family)
LATLAAPGVSATARSRPDVTDHDLVQAVRQGDDHAFERLYHRYHRRISAYIFGMVHDHGRAEDLTQEVFVSALRRMRQTDRPIAFKPWIYEIAKNASIDLFRRTKRTEEVSFDHDEGLGAADQVKLAATSPSPDAAVDAKQQLDHLCGAFGGLSDAHHQILVLRELEGLSYREIGERLGMSRPSVESTLFRARRRLTEEYEELVTGERCLRIQGVIASAHGALGLRDQRRVGTHISHCQPCRKQAVMAGLDAAAMARRPVRAKIAAFLPLPAFLRKRWLSDGHDAATAQAAQHGPSLAQMSVAASQYGESTMAGWMKATAVATAVAVAGVGTGAADHATGRHHAAPIVQRAGAGGGAAAGGGASAAAAQGSSRALSSSAGAVSRQGGGTGRGAGTAGGASGSSGSGAAVDPSTASGGAAGGPAAGGAAPAGTGSGAATGAAGTSVGATTSAGRSAGGVTQAVQDAAGGAGTTVSGATGAGSGTSGGGEPLLQPDLPPVAQAPAGSTPPSSAGAVVKDATDVVGGVAGGQVGQAVKDTGSTVGSAVDQVTEGVGGAVGGLLGGP